MKIFLKVQWLSVLALGLLALHGAALADAPAYLPVQGFLTDEEGTPLDGTIPVRFRLYDTDAPSGSAAEVLHEETQSLNVAGGHFTAYLGDAETLDLAIFRDHPLIFVGVRVDGEADELSPLLQRSGDRQVHLRGDQDGVKRRFESRSLQIGCKWVRWSCACDTLIKCNRHQSNAWTGYFDARRQPGELQLSSRALHEDECCGRYRR